jgi:kynurenine 3-monooxygenase
MPQKIIIIGAGLSGSLLAVRLAQKGFEVDVYEKRPDMRRETMSAGRSINLALSNRGIKGLHLVGLEDELLQLAIPMYGRMIHAVGQEPVLLPYSGRKGEYINSISRGDLNIALLNKAEASAGVRLFFNHPCTYVNLETAEAVFENYHKETIMAKGDLVIGTDGAGSALRNSMEQQLTGFTLSQQFLEHGYKELNLPPGPNGSFQIEKNALHIWPRGSYMVIALPNPAGDFTLTLFLAHKGTENSFENLRDAASVRTFFERNFPNLVPLLPDLEDQFFNNPTGYLGTIKCHPWQAFGHCLLLGDAAHAIVPFYGQGMNCSFEDVVVFDQLLDAYGTDWKQLLPAFEKSRKENADAIADLAVDNFYEMRDATADPVFQRKRKLETLLEQKFPGYFSKYSLVTFRDDISYKQAMIQGRKQDAALMKICAETDDVLSLDVNHVWQLLENQTKA